MSNALQDQLLKAGLTTKKKIKKEKFAKHQKTKTQKKNSTDIAESKLLVEQSNQKKRQRDRVLNQQKDNLAKQKAIVAQIKQLIDTSEIDLNCGETAYNFEDNNVVKRIYVSGKLIDQISRGKLAIIKFSEKYHLVPAVVANKIKDRDSRYIIVLNVAQSAESIDDEYADYEIPDDLMW